MSNISFYVYVSIIILFTVKCFILCVCMHSYVLVRTVLMLINRDRASITFPLQSRLIYITLSIEIRKKKTFK